MTPRIAACLRRGAVPLLSRVAAAVLLATAVPAGAAPAATVPACPNPTPFAVPFQAEGWQRVSSLAWANAAAAQHRGNDVIVAVGQPIRVAAKFAYGAADKDLEGEFVDAYLRPRPCDLWTHVGRTTTRHDADGAIWGMPLGDGYATLELPARSVPGPGVYPLVFRVAGDGSTARLDIHVVPRGQLAVVFDIDGTLTTSDAEVAKALAGDFAGRPYDPREWPGARDVAARYAAAGVLVVYLTGRPGALHAASRAWLRAHGYPPGPLICTRRGSEVMPNEAGVGTFKAGVLRSLIQDARLRFIAAYGNARTDIYAYRAAGIPTDRVFIIGKYAGEGGSQALGDYRTLLPNVPFLPRAPR